MFRVHLLLQ
jgi:hypothetical protein